MNNEWLLWLYFLKRKGGDENKVSITKYVYTSSIFFFRGDRFWTPTVQVGLGRNPGWGPASRGAKGISGSWIIEILKRTWNETLKSASIMMFLLTYIQ